MEKLIQNALQDLIDGVNTTGSAIHPHDEIRIKTYLRAIYKMDNGKYSLDCNEVRDFLSSNGKCTPLFINAFLKFVRDKNEGKHHKGIDHNLKISFLKKKWSQKS